MEIAAVLFLVGVWYACKEGGRATGRAIGTRRTASRAAATTRGGTHSREGSARRAARQATIGYWAGEARHGFPTTRHGFAQGWREHTEALAERERDAAAHQADTGDRIARLRAEAAAHRHRLAVTQQRANPPTMSDQLRVIPVHGQAGKTTTGDPHMGAPGADCTNPDCSCHASNPPLADGQTPGAPPVNGQAPPAPTNGGTVSGDMNYEQAVETADKLTQLADSAVNNAELTEATQLADGLAAMVPNDQTTLGHAGEVVQAVIDAMAVHLRIQEASQALKDRLETTYGPTHEDVQASGEDAAQPEFHSA